MTETLVSDEATQAALKPGQLTAGHAIWVSPHQSNVVAIVARLEGLLTRDSEKSGQR